MNSFELNSKACALSDARSGYSLAREVLELRAERDALSDAPMPPELPNLRSIDQVSDMTVELCFASCRSAGAFAQWISDRREGVSLDYDRKKAEGDA